MRPFSLVSLALAFFVAGCGSSKSVTGGIGTASSSGGSTGGTTGASGGTSTGGATDLSAGSPCTANGQCLSTICGAEGAGHCCVAACAIDDTTCGATDCDSSGACTYPVGQSCRTASCSAGVLTGNACTDGGTCLSGAPTDCPGNLICASGTTCLASCTQTSDCTSGFYCNGGSCATVLVEGASCTSNAACQSSLCGVAGSGHCCSTKCDTTDPVCGATGCDDAGACTYPTSTTFCGTANCSGSTLTTSACSGEGSCNLGVPKACPGSLNCANATSCLSTCALATDCLSGLYCNAGICATALSNGSACTSNSSCRSNVCGLAGTGHCCVTTCLTSDPVCGATACDDTGACVYTPAQTPCGTSSCAGSTLTNHACSGSGNCVSLGGVPCPNNLLCVTSGTACNATCVTNTDCAGDNTNFCDTFTGACCAPVANGASISIDSTLGSDVAACCGYGDAGACQTLTEAMRLVSGANGLAPGTLVTLNASVNAGVGSDWGNGETYPVVLGWGVTLSAPGVYFTDAKGDAEIFDVALQPGEDAGNAVQIQGSFGNAIQEIPVVIGSNSTATLTTDPVAVLVESGATLDIEMAYVYEDATNTGISVQSNATLGIVGSLYGLSLGAGLPSGVGFATTFGTGILCNGIVTDSQYSGTNSLNASSETISIDAEDGCSITLTENPQFGTATNGFNGVYTNAGGGCVSGNNKPDATAVLANGANATVTLGGAAISCMSNYGIEVTNSRNSIVPPTVTLQTGLHYTHINNCSGAGIYASAGTIYVQSTWIRWNFIGVDMETDSNGNSPTVYLNDNTGSTPQEKTWVECNSNQETGGGGPGIDVYNNSAGFLGADWVTWDDWYQPNSDANALWWTDTYYCDITFGCGCASVDSLGFPQCLNTNGPGGDGMNLVLGIGVGVGDAGSMPFGTYSLGAQAAGDGAATGYCQ